MTCIQCSKESKYKCPTCFEPYCSVVCYKEHKKVPCSKPMEPPQEKNELQKPITEYEYPTDDTVPLEKLQLLDIEGCETHLIKTPTESATTLKEVVDWKEELPSRLKAMRIKKRNLRKLSAHTRCHRLKRKLNSITEQLSNEVKCRRVTREEHAAQHSSELRKCLENPNVRNILELLDKSPYPDLKIQEYMQEPIFTELVDACLSVVQPQEDIS